MPDPVIYDWPVSIVPSAQVFYAPGQVFEGGFTSGGAEMISPEPGGRAYLNMAFNTLKGDSQGRLASWLFSKANAIFRVPLYRSVQLVAQADLPAPVDVYGVGVPWQDNAGGEVLWGDDVGWGVDYGAPATAVALEGSTSMVIDMANFGRILFAGHVIGYADRAYKVDAISYNDNDVATLTVTPPLRTGVDLTGDYLVTFRPSMLARMVDPAGFRAMFDLGKLVKPGNVLFAEVLV